MIPDNSAAKVTVRVREWWLVVAVGLVMLGVAWFYYWTVQTAAADLSMKGQKGDYYNLLIDGFADGHLYMKRDPDPRLLALPVAERPGTAPFMLDASLYQGHYYLYFGVTPVMVLMLPYMVLTGNDFPEALAAVVMMFMGFGFATWWWWEVRRKFFPRLAAGWVVLGVVALGLCTAAPSALRRPLFYEVAIGAGYAFSMVALWAVTRAWWRPKQRVWWLVIAGVAVGLAVGSRANLAPAGLLLLCAGAMGLAWRETGRGARVRMLVVTLCAAGAGAGAVGAGLAGYNYARFGSVAEFGHNHQMGANPKQMFRGENLRYNFALYYLKPPALNGYFPFVAPAEEGQKPSDYVGREHVHGEWLWTLVAVVAVLAAGVVLGRWREGDRVGWMGVWALPGLLFVVNGLVVSLTGVRSNRYMLDFQPALVLATWVALAAGLVRRGGWSSFLGAVVVVLVPVAGCFNVLASLQVHGFFQRTAPTSYARLAERADGLVWPWLRAEATGVGDREVELQWPTGNPGRRHEPVLAVGTKDFRDEIFVEYDDKGQVRFVYQHGEYGDVAGDWFSYVAGGRAKATIAGALLLPGVAHPWYGSRGADERRALKRRLRVRVDGQVRLDRDVVSYDSSPHLQNWGKGRQSDGKVAVFSGKIERVTVRPVDDAWMRARAAETGAIRLRLELPQDRYGLTEPLLQQGGARGFDTLAVEYVRPGFVRLLHDQQNGGGRWSEAFAVDYSQPQDVEVSVPAASDGGVWGAVDPSEASVMPGLLRVRWNGREAFRPDLPVLPAETLGVALGVNEWNSSGVGTFFGGRLVESPRLESLGFVRSGMLAGEMPLRDMVVVERGVWLRLDRADGKMAALVWERVQKSGLIRLGWVEAGRVSWLGCVEPVDGVALNVGVQVPELRGASEHVPAWVEVEVRNRAVLAHRTDFFATGSIQARGLRPLAWTGAALGRGPGASARAERSPPGRLRLRFMLPAGGFIGGDPLFSAGRAGSADSIFLRGIGDGRYVVGLDHWGLGSVESEPVALAAEDMHSLVIELASLGAAGELPRGRARLVLDGRVVLDGPQALYPVTPQEIVFGRNPLGMSTSGAVFRGQIVSVRTRAGVDETR